MYACACYCACCCILSVVVIMLKDSKKTQQSSSSESDASDGSQKGVGIEEEDFETIKLISNGAYGSVLRTIQCMILFAPLSGEAITNLV